MAQGLVLVAVRAVIRGTAVTALITTSVRVSLALEEVAVLAQAIDRLQGLVLIWLAAEEAVLVSWVRVAMERRGLVSAAAGVVQEEPPEVTEELALSAA